MAEHLREPKGSDRIDPPPPQELEVSINELILAYWDFARQQYTKNGKPTDQLYFSRSAFRPLRKLYGSILARDFGPKNLKAVREEMISAGLESSSGLNRYYINDHVGIINRMFRWGASAAERAYEPLHTPTGDEPVRLGNGGRELFEAQAHTVAGVVKGWDRQESMNL